MHGYLLKCICCDNIESVTFLYKHSPLTLGTFMQSKISSLLGLLGCIAILGFSGCARYKAKQFRRPQRTITVPSKEQSISMTHRVFTKSDCRKYLDRPVIKKGYQPVYISITNHSNANLFFSKENISLPCATTEEVAQAVHTSTKGRAIGYGLPGLVCWPFLIAAVVDGIGSAEANQQLDIDFAYKTINDQIINPHSAIHGLIFVPRECFDNNFTLTVVDPNSLDRFVLSPSKSTIKI